MTLVTGRAKPASKSQEQGKFRSLFVIGRLDIQVCEKHLMRTEAVMKSVKACLSLCNGGMALVGMANAMPLNSSARAVVPADLQQLISVDYRALKDSPTATALKQQMLAQENLKQFEGALKGVGIDPE